MNEIVISVLASIAASGALVGVLVWLSKEWISARLRSSIQHEYDQNLETFKAQLKAQSDVALVELRAVIQREAGLLTAATSSFAEGQKAAMERKLQAVDKLWGRVLLLRKGLPPILGFIDVLTVDEYKGVKNHPTFVALSEGWSIERIGQLVDSEVEQVRPFIGEYTWAVFFSYQAVMLRIVFLLYAGRTDADKLEWHKDSGTLQILRAVITAAEFAEFEANTFGKITWLHCRFESKILTATRKLVSGEEFGADALEQAQIIQQKVAQLNPKTT